MYADALKMKMIVLSSERYEEKRNERLDTYIYSIACTIAFARYEPSLEIFKSLHAASSLF